MRPLILLFLAGGLFGQPAPPPPAILKGSPPGGIGAHCTAPSLTGYLNSSGVLILCPSGTSVWTAQSSGGGSPFATLGVTVAPQLGSIFEVKDPTALNPLTDSQGYAPLSLNVFKRANHSWNLTSTDYSTDISDGLNVYQLLGGGVGFDVGQGAIGVHPMSFLIGPATGLFDFSTGGPTGQTASSFFEYSGSGTATANKLEIKAFPDPDGGGTSTSELEVFQDSVADATSGQAGTGANFGTYARTGVLHPGYRFGTNAIYSTGGTVFVSNGFTLFDYVNAENIWLASTARPHSFQLGDNITALMPAVVSIGTKFTISGCSAGTTLGGATAGSFLSGTSGTCTVVITMNGAIGLATAPNGWACTANDLTTPADVIHQTATSTTTATLSGTTVSGDVISFLCMGY